MQIEIPPDLEPFVKERAAAARFDCVEHYVYHLIEQDRDNAVYEERLTPEELAESLAMLDRGMADVAAAAR